MNWWPRNNNNNNVETYNNQNNQNNNDSKIYSKAELAEMDRATVDRPEHNQIEVDKISELLMDGDGEYGTRHPNNIHNIKKQNNLYDANLETTDWNTIRVYPNFFTKRGQYEIKTRYTDPKIAVDINALIKNNDNTNIHSFKFTKKIELVDTRTGQRFQVYPTIQNGGKRAKKQKKTKTAKKAKKSAKKTKRHR